MVSARGEQGWTFRNTPGAEKLVTSIDPSGKS